MTNSKRVDDTSLGIKEESVKSDVENKNTNNDGVPDSKEDEKTRTNMPIKQDSTNKTVCKSQSQKPKQGVSKQKVTRTRSKTLNSTESSIKHGTGNKKKEPNKENIVSPNHSITEYFSSLDLKEEEKDKDPNETVEMKLNKDNLKSRKTCLHQAKKPGSGNHKLTEYFAIRKSDRKLKKNTDFERQKDLEMKIENQVEDGLEVKEFHEKGRGIITKKKFFKGDFVIEYIGDLIDRSTAQEREAQYAKRKNVGCYMYYFRHKDRQYCIDATKESGKLGRLINHSRKGNLISRIIEVDGVPHLVLFAKVDITIGTELLYDYGDRNQESIKNHPWLNL